jgi:pyruvate,orthophosphate dikinase
MPGILSTVVFVGMNDKIAEALAAEGPWSAYDSYRRFLASYAREVWGLDLEAFDLVERAKREHGVQRKKDLPWERMRQVVEESKAVIRQNGFGDQLDQILADPRKQVLGAVDSLLASWRKTTANRYRDIKGICDSWDTAAIIQEMAFGNRLTEPVAIGMDEAQASLTGVIPRTFVTDAGVRAFSGEFKFSAAGDDLVSGLSSSSSFRSVEGELRELMPMLEARLKHGLAKLRRFMGTDQEVEFTVDRGVLSMLQTRTAETPADRGIEAFLDPGEPITRGLGVCGGAFRGLVAFDDEDRKKMAERARSSDVDVDGVLMVVENPTPEDIPVIISADGLLAAKGGSTSHAAVAINGVDVRRVSAVMSAVGLRVDLQKREAVFHDPEGAPTHTVRVGDVLSIHGTSGEVHIGPRELRRPPSA